MRGTDKLILKWAAQMAELKAQAEAAPPGEERDGLLHRIALCQKAIEAAEMLAPPERHPMPPKEPSRRLRA